MKMVKWMSVLTLLGASAAHAGQTGLYYQTEWDGASRSGNEVFYSDAQRRFSAAVIPGAFGSEEPSVRIRMTSPPDFASGIGAQGDGELVFSAPEGAPLAVGSYTDAASNPMTSQAGISLGGAAFGYCSVATGSFDVKEIVYEALGGASSSPVIRFAADFVYRCESSGQTIAGSIRFDSDVALPAGLPLAIGSDDKLNSAGCFEATSMDGNELTLQAVNGSGTQSYQWSVKVEGRPTASSGPSLDPSAPVLGGSDPSPILSGSTLSLSTPSFGLPATLPVLRTLEGSGERFSFHLARANTEQAKVLLTATDRVTGEVEEARLTACVSDSTAPKVIIHEPRDGEQIVGSTFFLHASVEDSIDPDLIYYAKLGAYVIEFKAGERTRVKVPDALRAKGEPNPLEFTVKARDSGYNWAEETVDVVVHHDMRNQGD